MARNFITLIVSLYTCSQLATINGFVPEEEWDYLVLAQFWPPSSCVYFKQPDCVPPQVHNWTIHGLWPSIRGSSKQPENCNKSMPFNYDEIKELWQDLDLYWPYYDKDSKDKEYLWDHEWDKHGTCAYSLPLLRGELKYFSQVIALYQQQDLLGGLAQAKIVPSDSQQYNLTDILDDIQSHFNTSPVISCVNDSNGQYLSEIWLCFEKNLTRADCEESALLHAASNQRKGNRRPFLKFRSEKELPAVSGRKFIDCKLTELVWYKKIPTV